MTIIDKFESTCDKYPNNIALIDDSKQLSFSKLKYISKSIASSLLNNNHKIKDIVAIFTERSTRTIECMLASLYAGCAYVVLDNKSPMERIFKILSVLEPKSIIFDDSLQLEQANLVKETFPSILLLSYDEMIKENICEEKINLVKENNVSTNPSYVLFTSGSTGNPKGTVVSNDNVLSYIEWVSNEFKFNDKTVFGSQTPFYFSMSVTDVYSTLFKGSTLVIIPKSYFSFPVKVMEMLNKYEVNTIYWVPSAYAIMANLKVLNYILPEHLKTALFAGEVMMPKTLKIWQEHLPNVLFANLFGPTETTDICTFYKVDHLFNVDEVIPIGKSCHNLDVFLLNEDKKIVKEDEVGELYCRGPFVALGYYNNPEKTKEAFVQNPLNNHYPEIVYKTGDLCKYNKKGELIYISRKDFQIKRSGYRIELGEIEAAASAIDKINNAFCIYNSKSDQIILIYEGKIDASTLSNELKKKIPNYMLPNKYEKQTKIVYNQNGKIDRNYYKKMLGE